MTSNYSAYLYFRAFVKKWLKDNNRTQNWLALELKVEDGTISKYLGKDFRIAPFEKQLQISNIIKVDYLEILQKGKDIIDGKPVKRIKILSEHQALVSKFLKKDRAIRINEKLIYAEQLDEDALDKIERQIDLELEDLEKRAGIKKKHTANGKD